MLSLLLQLMTKWALRIQLVYHTDTVSFKNGTTNFDNKHLPNLN